MKPQQQPAPSLLEQAIEAYRVATGFSIWESDGDTWDDNTPVAQSLRAAWWLERRQTTV